MREYITNRKNQRLSIVIDLPPKPKGVAFVMHGLSGNKDQDHIAIIAKTFYEKNLTTVRFDVANTFGESEGKYENATISNYFEDLEDIISWAKTCSWFATPFFLAGHSVGGYCITLFAENNPSEVKALFPISPIITGAYWSESLNTEELANWKTTGWQIKKSPLRPGLIKKLRWSFVEDALNHSLFTKIANLTMPIFITVGEYDAVAKLVHQRIFLNKIPSSQKTLSIISSAPHTFVDQSHLKELKQSIAKSLEETL